MKLYIAEKPELAKAIAKGLGGGSAKAGYIDCGEDRVTWCFGHLLELYDPEDYDPAHKRWQMDTLPIAMTPWQYKPRDKAKKQLKVIEGLLKQANEVVHAGDPDAEGQLLVEEVLGYFGNHKPVKRLLINDLTPKLVQGALANLRDNQEFQGLYRSALARSVADKLYGFNLTRAYTLMARQQGHDSVLSVGRVQTPVLGLVVNRDRQHEGHQSRDYYLLDAIVVVKGVAFQARLMPAGDAPVDEQGRVTDEGYLQAIAAACQEKEAKIIQADTKPQSAPPPLPYNLLNLQADAHKQHGIKPDDTLKITQALRETHQLITYNRSDCQYLSEEQHADAPAVLAAVAGVDPELHAQAEGANTEIKSRAFNSANVSAHHAIIPTTQTADWAKLSKKEQQLYHLIARAYVAQFYPPKETEQTSVVIDISGHRFSATSTVLLKPGWSVLYSQLGLVETEAADACDAAADLRALNAQDIGLCESLSVQTKQTKPPARYTQGTLLKDLASVAKYVTDPQIKSLLKAKDQGKKGEHGGIGTPATRSTILETLLSRGFVAEKGKHLVSTELGRAFIDLLPERAKTPDMTALWHAEQERIEAGEQDVETFISDLMAYLQAEIEALKEMGLAIQAPSGPACPVCNQGVLRKRKGKAGVFWGCNRYPDCAATCPDKQGKPNPEAKAKRVEVSTEHLCEDCGKGLVRRLSKNKKGYWWGCSGYPDCKRTYKDQDGTPAPWPRREAAEASA